MAKTRIGERITKVTTGEAKDGAKGRSEELAEFNEKFDEFTKKFKPLTAVLKNHHTHLQKMEKSQNEVMEELTKWIELTPIEGGETNAVKIQQEILKKERFHTEKYIKDAMEYVKEWELVCKTRVEASRKQVKELKSDLDHYEKKLEALNKNHEASVAKEKKPGDKEVERLKRNEEKFALARDSYEATATRLVLLMEEIVGCAWKDILPLLLRMMKTDSTKIEDQKHIIESSNIIQNLQNLADEYKIDVTTPAPGAVEKVAPLPEKE